MERLVTLHHLACSGGTIFSRAIAAMNDVAILSEVHPDRHLGSRYDPLVQIEKGYGLSADERRLLDARFLQDIQTCYDLCRNRGLTLIVRDHGHRDFVETDRFRSRLIEVLSERFVIRPVVSIRDPVDVWLSYRQQGWFPGGTPDELCRRSLKLVEAFPDAPVYRYEDFVEDPTPVLVDICDTFGLSFNPDYQEKMQTITHLTGDSGRRGPDITNRPRQRISKEEVQAFRCSRNYKELRKRFGYHQISQREGLWPAKLTRIIKMFDE